MADKKTSRTQRNLRMSPYTQAEMLPDGYTLLNSDYTTATLLIGELNSGKWTYGEIRRKFDELGVCLPNNDNEVVDLAIVPLGPWFIEKDSWSGDEVKYHECTRFVILIVK